MDKHLVEVLLERFLRHLARVVVQPVAVIIVRQTVVVHAEHLQHINGDVQLQVPCSYEPVNAQCFQSQSERVNVLQNYQKNNAASSRLFSYRYLLLNSVVVLYHYYKIVN